MSKSANRKRSSNAIASLLHVLRNTIFALLLLIAGVFPTEYFVSIEPMRFLFIWVIVSEQVNGFGQRFLQSLKRWLPYLLIWLANAAWLAYFYTIGGYDSYDVEVVKAAADPPAHPFHDWRSNLESRDLCLGAGTCADFKGNHCSHHPGDVCIDRCSLLFLSFSILENLIYRKAKQGPLQFLRS